MYCKTFFFKISPLKTLLLLAALLSSSLFAAATTLSGKTYATATPATDSCDAIIFLNGRVLKGKIIEVSSAAVRLHRCNISQDSVTVVSTANIRIIRYANGTVEDFAKHSVTNLKKKPPTNAADITTP
jgi:hypothetical protein